MLSIVIIILTFIIQQTYQLETIEAVLSSTVELPCSVTGQNIQSTNPAKVNARRDKCLCVRVAFVIVGMVLFKEEKNI
jgi:hypothetical protein